MKRLILTCLLLAASSLHAQQGTLKAMTTRLSADGGTVTLTASAAYERADVLGWTVRLPAGWNFQGTAGANAPEIVPAHGAMNALDWAYVTVPAGKADFDFTLYYPPGLYGGQVVRAEMVVRVDGKTTSVPVTPLTFRAPPLPRGQGRPVQ